MQAFKAPKESLGDLDANVAATLIAAAADIALVVDGQGVIRDLALSRPELSSELDGARAWLGQPWADTVTDDCKPKVAAALEEASSRSYSRWRQINHKLPSGPDIPVLYSVARISGNDRFVAIGRDMRALAQLQQRLVEAQIAIERDYSRLRHVETRYRVLFQASSEAVFVVDAETDKVVEANPAAVSVFGDSVGRSISRAVTGKLDAESVLSVQSLSTGIRSGRSTDNVRVHLAGSEDGFTISTSTFRQGAAAFYLMRFTPFAMADGRAAQSESSAALLGLLKKAPDAHVVIDQDGRILAANFAFLQMAQVMTEDQARGESLERWLGRSGVDVSVLIANLRQHGSVTLFSTLLRGEQGSNSDVELSGVALTNGNKPTFGLSIRSVGRRLSENVVPGQLMKSVEQLKELIGRVPLKDVVRETTDIIEKLCIEAALELTGDNRASAAEMLGLSRQSLYVKLRRFGLAEIAEPYHEK